MFKDRFTLFSRIIALLVLFLLIIGGFYAYSNRSNMLHLQNEIEETQFQQLLLLQHQIDTDVDQLSLFSVTLSRDPNVREFKDAYLYALIDSYDKVANHVAISQKMQLQSLLSSWDNSILVYSPLLDESIGTANSHKNTDYKTAIKDTPWVYRDNWFFRTWVETQPTPGDPKQPVLVIRTGFAADNIAKMLHRYSQGGKGEPFLYRTGHPPIQSPDSDNKLVQNVIDLLPEQETSAETFKRIVRLDGKAYFVQTLVLHALDWRIATIVPLEQILQPARHSRNLFYGAIIILLLISIVAALLLYRHVQIPLRDLTSGVRNLKKGNYSIRLRPEGRGEFAFLLRRFNELTAEIDLLIHTVYAEKIRSADAILKQLQSQINPHFLYNCLGFIINMAKLKNEQAVIAMAYNLSKYYRYTTRVDIKKVKVRDEIDLIRNYLEIQKLRMERISYTIDIPEELLDAELPLLIIQPIVENSILHGVQDDINAGNVQISGSKDGSLMRIDVEDDGSVADEVLSALHRLLGSDSPPTGGYGLWNVHHRLIRAYGPRAGLSFAKTAGGGLSVRIVWSETDKEQEGNLS